MKYQVKVIVFCANKTKINVSRPNCSFSNQIAVRYYLYSKEHCIMILIWYRQHVQYNFGFQYISNKGAVVVVIIC